MHDHGKSDGPVVPAKLPNNAGAPAVEAVEGRGSAEGNATSKARPGRRAGQGALSALGRVRRVARKDKVARFPALLHHVTVDRLRGPTRRSVPGAAPGVDDVRWRGYGQDLERNLRDLHGRVHRGAYRSRPSRRAYIPKADGRLRPLGVAAWRTRSSNGRWSRCWAPSTSRTSSGFPTGFGPAVRRMRAGRAFGRDHP